MTKRVFVLGAGASNGAGFPLASELFKLAYDQMDSDDQSDVKRAYRYLYPVSGRNGRSPLSPQTLANVNVEEFLSLLNMAEEFNGIRPTTFLKPGLIRKVRASLLRSIVELLVEKQQNAECSKKSVEYVDRFLCRLEAGDTIITFNWDLLLERRMRKRRLAFRLNPRRKSNRITYLKVHGSIDWYLGEELDSLNESQVLYRQLYKAPWSKVSGERDKFLNNTLPFIVQPTFNKAYEGSADLEEIWVQAFKRLYKADEIYVCGYSFPLEDLFARFVLRRAIRFNEILRKRRRKRKIPTPSLRLKVIDPCPEVAEFVREKIYDCVQHEKEYFETSSLTS